MILAYIGVDGTISWLMPLRSTIETEYGCVVSRTTYSPSKNTAGGSRPLAATKLEKILPFTALTADIWNVQPVNTLRVYAADIESRVV